MPYLVKGNAEEIFSAFDFKQFVSPAEASAAKVLQVDRSRIPFLGTEIEANQFFAACTEPEVGQFYFQGNLSAGILSLFTADRLKEAHELSNVLKCHSFAYMNEHHQPCGIMIHYHQNNPSKWVIGLIKNPHRAPRDREVMLLSSIDLADKAKNKAEIPLVSEVVPLESNQLMQQLDSGLLKQLMHYVFDAENDKINEYCARIKLLQRTFQIDSNGVKLKDPVNLSEIDVARLFTDNHALDLLFKYNVLADIPLSFALLKDCLSDDSGFCQELQQFVPTDNQKLNANILKLIMVLYEANSLDSHRKVLKKSEFIVKYGPFMSTLEQVKLIPFLATAGYSEQLIHNILSKEFYYTAVAILVELELTEKIPEFFNDPQKLAELNYISQEEVHCRRLCLIFWYKTSLTKDGYLELIEATKKYPLMASALVSHCSEGRVLNDETGGASDSHAEAAGLKKLVLNAQEHLSISIMYHFFSDQDEEKSLYLGYLHQLGEPALDAASKALTVLKNTEIKEKYRYSLVLDNGDQGKALRSFLPQLAQVKDPITRKLLIHILYQGVTRNIAIQGQELAKITDPGQKSLAVELCKRYTYVKQLQELRFSDEVVVWAAQMHHEQAKCFRQIIARVETQCKIISGRLPGLADKKICLKWEQAEADYRKELYAIAYQALTSPRKNKRNSLDEAIKKIKKAEQGMLEIIDPAEDSTLYQAFVVIANIFITLLTVGIANYFNEQRTGKYWFFTQSRSGEELSVLNKQLIHMIQQPNTCDEAPSCFV